MINKHTSYYTEGVMLNGRTHLYGKTELGWGPLGLEMSLEVDSVMVIDGAPANSSSFAHRGPKTSASSRAFRMASMKSSVVLSTE